MADSSIIKYIKDQAKAGYTEDQIRSALSQQGWQSEEIEEALSIASASMVPEKAQATQPAPAQTPAGKQPVLEKPVLKKPAAKSAAPVQAARSDPVKDRVVQMGQIQSKKKGFGAGAAVGIIGGILILLNALLLYLGIGDILSMIMPDLSITLLNLIGISLAEFELMIINIIVGIGVTACAAVGGAKPNQRVISGVVVVSLGVMALLSGNGFIIGALVSMVGGALILTE